MAKKGPKKGEGGRPKIEMDWHTFETACSLLATKDEVLGLLDISEATLDRRIKEKYNDTFEGVLKRRGSQAKISLRRIQFNLARTNAGMAIFLGKNYLKQTDSQLIEIENADEHCKRIADTLKQSYTKAD